MSWGPAAEAGALLAWRRWRLDRWILGVLALLVAVGSLLAVAVPRLTTQAGNDGLAQAVRDAGSAADVVARQEFNVTVGNFGTGNATSAEEVEATRVAFDDAVPDEVWQATDDALVSVVSDALRVNEFDPDEGFGDWTGDLARVAYVDDWTQHVTFTAGTAPSTEAVGDGFATRVEVAVAEDVAEALGMSVGSEWLLGTPGAERFLRVAVTGLFTADDPDDPRWTSTPAAVQAPAVGQSGTLLLEDETLRMAHVSAPAATFTAEYRRPTLPDGLAAAWAPRLRDAVALTVAQPEDLLPDAQPDVTVVSTLEPVLSTFLARQQAVNATVAVILVGLVAAGALVVVLAVQMLVERRRTAIALEHARGASVRQIWVRTAVESTLVTLLAVGIGWVVGRQIGHPTSGLNVTLLALVAVALVAPPLVAALAARRSAGRRRRGDLTARRRGNPKRVVAEALVVVLAVAGVQAIRARDVQAVPAGGVDLFLSAVPLVLAAVAALAVLRLYPYPLRLLVAAMSRRPGVVGLLGAARAARTAPGGLLPLLVLTLAVALSISAGVVRETVVEGQEKASWERTGAAARVSAEELPEDTVQAVSSAPGVTSSVPMAVRGALGMRVGSQFPRTTLVAVDPEQFAALLAQTPLDGADRVRALADHPGGDGVPILASAGLASGFGDNTVTMTFGATSVPALPAGVLPAETLRWVSGSFVVADAQALAAQLGEPLAPNTVLLLGDPDATALEAAAGGAVAPTVQVRTAWLADLASSPLIRGALALLWLTVVAVGAYALVALLLVLLTTADVRGRTLSYLRTLGLTQRQGWWLSLLELIPLVTAAALAGVVAGVAIPRLLAPALGLDALAGGTEAPLRISVVFVAGFVAALVAVVVAATVVEILRNRRRRLGSVLRVGEA